MIGRQEDAALELVLTVSALRRRGVALDEARAQVLNLRCELIGLKDLVGEGGKGEIKVVFYARAFQALRLGDRRPDLRQVLDQRVAQVRERGSADMVAYDEEQERSGGRPAPAMLVHSPYRRRLEQNPTACP